MPRLSFLLNINKLKQTWPWLKRNESIISLNGSGAKGLAVMFFDSDKLRNMKDKFITDCPFKVQQV